MPTSPDDPGIRPWKPREPVDHRRLNALQERTVNDILAGPGLRMIRKGNSVAIALKDRPRVAAGAFRVRITGNATGPGFYLGKRIDVSPGFPSTGADLDTLHTLIGDELLIVNRYEGTAGTGHSLTESPAQLEHKATWGSTTTDSPSRRIALIDGISFNDCPGDIDGGSF